MNTDGSAHAGVPAPTKRILYLEDARVSQQVMRRVLAGVGEIVLAATVPEARAQLAQRKLDLIIADYMVETETALDFIDSVRQTADWRCLPIIVVSSTLDDILLDQVLKVGANDAFGKPIKPDFAAVVSRMLENPYLREPRAGITGVRCFQWQVGSQFYQYCPEVSVTISGNTREEVSARMLAFLEEKGGPGTGLGYTRNESVIVYSVRTSPA
jgi:CheY-like chemotaxis protein